MFNSRRIISVFICGLIFTVAVNAGMVPVSQQDTESMQRQSVSDKVKYSSYNFLNGTNLDSWSIGYLPQSSSDTEQTSGLQHLQSFTNGPGSLNLCLSALIGLGLCSSAHFVKKLSFSFVPEWYHNGGPFQIGHSLAVSPDSLCPAIDCCFVQPTYLVEDSFKKYLLGTIVSLWRKSQFTPDIIASRAPPNIF